MQSVWRSLVYKRLSEVSLDGTVIDLGGSKNAEYHALIKGNRVIKAVNIDKENGYDFSFDLEKKFPLESEVYNHALCINVLEHIYNHKMLLHETSRILKTGGSFIIAVPFMIQVHPCPFDHWRYTRQTLERLFKEAGFQEVNIEEIGKGPFTAATQILHNILKFNIVRFCAQHIASGIDLFVKKYCGDAYSSRYYPLGYIVIAKK